MEGITESKSISEESIRSHLDAIGKIGRDPKGGWTRLAFSTEEQKVHDYSKRILGQQGYSIIIDSFGNLIGSKRGLNPHNKRIMLGTHLDTVPNGGNYDGMVGFVTAVEAVKAAEDVKGRLDYGIDIVIFRAEESSRFNRACLGSSAAFGFLKPNDLAQLKDSNKVSLEEALIKNGFEPNKIGDPLLNISDYGAYFETHIEQASVLESKNIPVGIVTSIRAPERRKIDIKGKDSHIAAAYIIRNIENLVSVFHHRDVDIVATVGRVDGYFHVSPNKMNVISGNVSFKIKEFNDDIKEWYDRIVKQRGVTYDIEQEDDGYKVIVRGLSGHSGGTPMETTVRKDALAAAAEMLIQTTPSALPEYDGKISLYVDLRGNNEKTRSMISRLIKMDVDDPSKRRLILCNVNLSDPIEYSEPQLLNETLQHKLEASAKQLDIKTMYLPSGAGHDALKASQAGIPTGMLFVPSKNGLSHNPNEFTDNKYIMDAIRVMANFLLNYDSSSSN